MIIAPFCPPHKDTNPNVPDVLYEAFQACRKSVETFAPSAEFIDTSHSRYDYWNAVSSRWNTGQDLIIIEHDIEISENVIPSFTACGEDWCTFRYESRVGRGDYWDAAIGCVKFSVDFQVKVNISSPDDSMKQWVHLGNWIRDCQVRAGYHDPHVHGTVNHLHYPLGPGM